MGRLRKLIPRFSLRTLAIFTLLCTSGFGLWWHWEPWYCRWEDGAIARRRADAIDRRISPDAKRTLVLRQPDAKSCIITGAVQDADGLELKGHRGEVIAGVWSRSGKLIATGDTHGYVSLWNADAGTCVKEFSVGGDVQDIAFSPDARHLAIAAVGFTAVLIYSAETGEWERGLTLPLSPHEVAWAPDGKSILSVSFGVKLWDTETWRLLGKLDRYMETVNSASFSPCGKRIVTVSADDWICIWDTESRDCLAALFVGDIACGYNRFASFSGDGKEVITGSLNDIALVYRRRRPEWWWGVFWLWEFWLTVAFAGVFVWSVVRDRRALGNREAG